MAYKNKEKRIAHQKEYYRENREKILEYKKQYLKDNLKKIEERIKLWMIKNPEKKSEYGKKDYCKHHEKRCEKHREWYKNNKEERIKQIIQWQKDNSDKIIAIKKRYHKRNKMNLQYKINNNMGSAMWRSLRGNKNGQCWEDLVGYTTNDLIKRLKKTMPKGFTWQDYLDGKLHIDHKIPVTAFNFTKPEHIDFQRCWDLENLRLLSAKENIIKKNKLFKPFQPALQI